jgi:DNA polymerase
LAGQEEALEELRQGIDRYKIMAAKIFRTTVDKITKDERFVGKETVLGCGFGLGVDGFIASCKRRGVVIERELGENSVGAYRETHKKVVSLWYSLEGACKRAINSPGQKIKVGKHLTVFCMTTAGKRFLMIRLPSGRHLAYPEPQIDESGITFYGQIKDKALWGRVRLWGALIAENVTQGVAADCMGVGAINATRAGHDIIMLVHDEAVRTTRGSAHTLEHFIKCLTDMPAWADGLPLVAEGETIPHYRK